MADAPARGRVSAGILLYRRRETGLEVLLGHPGGPYFEGRDEGVWSIPKGEVETGEGLIDVALREFEEETGHAVGSASAPLPLGSIVQAGGKTVHAWAIEGSLDPAAAVSNTFKLEWPPRSGLFLDVPEVDRVAWFTPLQADVAMNRAQLEFVARLIETLPSD